jgi:L-aspartate oxidase
VFAARIGEELARELPPAAQPTAGDDVEPGLLAPSAQIAVQSAMTTGAGVLRTGRSLRDVAAALHAVVPEQTRPGVEAWEATNLHTVASALVAGAALRAETRGCHWREDHPDSGEAWLGHVVTTMARDGSLRADFQPVAAR